MLKKIIINCITILFIALFLYTGISKLLGNKGFIEQAEQIPFLSPIASWLVWAAPILELGVVILLIRMRWRLIGLYACFSLMSLFTIYMALFIWYSDGTTCGCGGVLERIPPNLHLLLNIFLAILAIPAIWLQKKFKKSIAQELSTGSKKDPVGKAA